MKTNRKRTRKFLFQVLYSMHFNIFDFSEFKKNFYDGKFTFEIDQDYITEMISCIQGNQDFIVDVITEISPKFQVDKMNIMSVIPIVIGITEMFLIKEEIPAKVSINEAIEVSKAYWDDSTKNIVNGALNTAFNNYDTLKKYLDSPKNPKNIVIFKK